MELRRFGSRRETCLPRKLPLPGTFARDDHPTETEGSLGFARDDHPSWGGQFLKKRSVMNHGLAQVFRAGLPVRRAAKRGLVGSTVIFEDPWMIHGDIRRTRLKIGERVAARGQD